MKNIFKLGLLSMLSFSVVSCAVDEISDYSTLADVAILTSVSDNNNHEFIYKSTMSHLSIMDVSQGALSHKWIVPEGEGVYLLKGDPIKESQTDLNNNWANYIDPTIPYTNSLSVLHLYFDETAATTDGEPIVIKMVNTFDKPVTYNYLVDHEGKQPAKIESVEKNGKYELTIPFTVYVYDKVMTPSAKYYSDAAMKNELPTREVKTTNADGEEVITQWLDVNVGQTVYFEDTSTDRPNIWAWNITPPAPASKVTYSTQNMEYTFTEVSASANAGTTISLGVQRAAEGNGYYDKTIPTAAMKTVNPLVKVHVSNDVPENPAIKSVMWNPASKGIEIAVDGAMFDISTLSQCAANFTVKYSNANKGETDKLVAVQSVTVKSDDAGTPDDPADDIEYPNTIVLNFPVEGGVYTDDVVTVSYVPASEKNLLYAGGNIALGAVQKEFVMAETAVEIMGKDLFNYDFEKADLGTSDGWIMRKSEGSNSANEVYDSKPQVYLNPLYGESSENNSSQCLYVNLNKARRESGNSTACLTLDDFARVFTPIMKEGVPYQVSFQYRYDDPAQSATSVISSQISIFSAWNITTANKYGYELVASSNNNTETCSDWKTCTKVVTMSANVDTSEKDSKGNIVTSDIKSQFDWSPFMTFSEEWNCRMWIDNFKASVYYPRP